MRGKPWTPEEDALLRKLHNKMPRHELYRYFNGRSESSVTNRCYALNLSMPKTSSFKSADSVPKDHPLLNWGSYKRKA